MVVVVGGVGWEGKGKKKKRDGCASSQTKIKRHKGREFGWSGVWQERKGAAYTLIIMGWQQRRCITSVRTHARTCMGLRTCAQPSLTTSLFTLSPFSHSVPNSWWLMVCLRVRWFVGPFGGWAGFIYSTKKRAAPAQANIKKKEKRKRKKRLRIHGKKEAPLRLLGIHTYPVVERGDLVVHLEAHGLADEQRPQVLARRPAPRLQPGVGGWVEGWLWVGGSVGVWVGGCVCECARAKSK